jgi:uncharacterized delta-60 repeat protein
LQGDGTLDPTFDPGAGANGSINLVALQSDGKVLIAGSFTTVAGKTRPKIARLNSDGSVDSTFDPGTGPDGDVAELLIDASGKAVLAGRFGTFNGVVRHALVRLNANGEVDPTFNAGRDFTSVGLPIAVLHLAIYPDGQLIPVGFFGAGGKFDLIRVAVDGTVDQSFLAKGLSNSLVVAQPDGRVLVGGGFLNGSTNNVGLVRVNADGQTDVTFRQAANTPTVVRLQADGRILFVYAGQLRRLNSDGSDDASFVVPQTGSGREATGSSVSGVELQADGRIVISGSFNTVNGVPRVGVARLFSNGSVDPTFVPAPSIIATGFVLNLSTRVAVGTGDHVLIGGFIVDGANSKKLMLRAIGPSLASSGAAVPTPLADPRVILRDSSGTALAQNDNWRTTQTGGLITSDQSSAIQASGIAPKNDAESALIVTLAPGAYTATVEGAGGGTALVEMYDLDGNTATRVANISTRGDVATENNVMIAGAILGGTHQTEVLVRALGPSLLSSGVTGALQDPSLKLYNSNGFLVGSNENWRDTQEGDIRSTQAAPTDNRESAILALLQPGNYTAVVRGKGDTTGVALVEFYSL